MLVTRGEQAALERYIMRAKDTELMRWWAGYCESLGHIDSAQHCYESVGDYYSLVRVACFSNQTNHAVEIIGQSFFDAGYLNNNLMILPPMALIVVGLIIWVQRSRNRELIEDN